MHANADDISRHDAFRHHRLQRLIDENGIAHGLRGRRRKNEQPSWGNDSGTKRIVAGIYEMNTHGFGPFPVQAWRLRRGTLAIKTSMANWFLLLHPPDRRNTGKRTDSQAGDVASPRKRKLRKIETKGSGPGRIVSRVVHPSWFCWDGDFAFQVTLCPPRRAKRSPSRRRPRGIRSYGP